MIAALRRVAGKTGSELRSRRCRLFLGSPGDPAYAVRRVRFIPPAYKIL